jgi:hypothetical protein
MTGTDTAWRWLVLGGVSIVLATAAAAQPNGRGPARYQPEAQTPFEARLTTRAAQADALHAGIKAEPAGSNARGLILSGGDAAVVDMTVTGRKYGVSLDGTGDVLIKNFVYTDRQSMDIFGSGLILGPKTPTKGQTWLSNAWIDLKGKGPIPDYKLANNEPISVELRNAPLNIRRAVLIGGEESGIDNKSQVRIDASFIASGHRTIRTWRGGSTVIANSIVLAHPGYVGLWFGGGEGEARFEYYNCLFGAVGDKWEDLSSDPPEWMLQTEHEDPVRVTLRRLDKDPFSRGSDSFWVRAEAPVPSGYLKGPRS